MYGRPCFSLRGMIWVFLQYSHIILNLTDCRIICYHMLSYYICIHLALPRSTTAGSRLAGLVRLESSQNGRTIQVSEILWFTQIFMVFCNKNHWQQQQQHLSSPLIASGQAPRGWTAEHLATGGVETKRAERERIGSISPILVPGFVKMEDLANNNRLVGGWNMNFMFFHSVGNVIIPTDELFGEGRLKPPINRDLLGLTGIYRLECDLTRR